MYTTETEIGIWGGFSLPVGESITMPEEFYISRGNLSTAQEVNLELHICSCEGGVYMDI